MHLPSTSALLLSLAAAATAPAAVSTSEPDPSDCNHPAYDSQAKQNHCATLRYLNADKALNLTYRSTLKRLNEGQRRELIQEQRRWLRRLEPQCRLVLGPRKEAGNMWAMEYADCLAAATEERTKMLGRWRGK